MLFSVFIAHGFKMQQKDVSCFFPWILRCICADGFEGENCEVNVDDCEDNDCENNSTCVDGVNNYTCLCPPEYTGTKHGKHCAHNQYIRLKA
jgi:hypothetical protein